MSHKTHYVNFGSNESYVLSNANNPEFHKQSGIVLGTSVVSSYVGGAASYAGGAIGGWAASTGLAMVSQSLFSAEGLTSENWDDVFLSSSASYWGSYAANVVGREIAGLNGKSSAPDRGEEKQSGAGENTEKDPAEDTQEKVDTISNEPKNEEPVLIASNDKNFVPQPKPKKTELEIAIDKQIAAVRSERNRINQRSQFGLNYSYQDDEIGGFIYKGTEGIIFKDYVDRDYRLGKIDILAGEGYKEGSGFSNAGIRPEKGSYAALVIGVRPSLTTSSIINPKGNAINLYKNLSALLNNVPIYVVSNDTAVYRFTSKGYSVYIK